VLAADQITLILQGLMHLLHAIESMDLGLQDDWIVGLGEKVITTGLKTLNQCPGISQAGKKNDWNQVLARLQLHPASGLEAIHYGHQCIQQYQVRPLQAELDQRLKTVLGTEHLVTKPLDQSSKDHPVGRIIVRYQYLQRGYLLKTQARGPVVSHGLFDTEELFEIRDAQNLAHILITMNDPYIGCIATGVISEQKQHSQCGAVYVVSVMKVDYKAFGGQSTAFVGFSEILMRAEIESPGHLYC
jgi:hypothetical protein